LREKIITLLLKKRYIMEELVEKPSEVGDGLVERRNPTGNAL
jgi:hypothetical protein